MFLTYNSRLSKYGYSYDGLNRSKASERGLA